MPAGAAPSGRSRSSRAASQPAWRDGGRTWATPERDVGQGRARRECRAGAAPSTGSGRSVSSATFRVPRPGRNIRATPSLMPIPRETSEELQRRRLAEHREAEHDKRWDYVRTALECWGWCILGLALIAWSLHTSDELYGRAAFWAGLGIG